jgi:UDP-N-acetyl-D-glucosamine dehydrogenase
VTAALNRDRKAVNGSRIVVLGVAYKPNVGDLRESPAEPIIEQLTHLGAIVTAIDPHAEVGHFAGVPVRADVDDDLLRTCDLALVVTDHGDFDLAALASKAPRVLDTRNRVPAAPNVEVL